MADFEDPFAEAREKARVLKCPFQGESVPMILRHADVRDAAKDWAKFSSDAPFRVPIPSEEDVRSVRQLPIETDPPEHGEFRKIVEPFFKRAKDPSVIEKVDSLIARFVDGALAGETVEIVREFALPIQSHALTYLLNVPEAEAETWTSWGTHVFKDGVGEKKGAALESYLNAQFDRAEVAPGDDFFSALIAAEFQGEPLTRDQMLGFANLTFAGGRDTVINTISSVIGYLAKHPETLAYFREDPSRVALGSEEFFRVFSPLTHIGRVCPVASDVHGVPVKPSGRVSLGWAAANYDSEAFDSPEEVRLDRKPNPHLAFGAGPHVCLGAPHARLLTRSLLRVLSERVSKIELIASEDLVEEEAEYSRVVGYEHLDVKFRGF